MVKNDSGIIPFDADTKNLFESNFFDEISDDSIKGDGIAIMIISLSWMIWSISEDIWSLFKSSEFLLSFIFF